MDKKEKMYESIAAIRVEEFLIYYNKAFKRDNIKALEQLEELFPEAAKLAFDLDYLDSLSDPADDECLYEHPIVIESNRMTQSRVMDIIMYLLGKNEVPNRYEKVLEERIAYRHVFNYRFERYLRDYDKDALWNYYFLGLPKLRVVIEHRSIRSLEELVWRASNYYERCL